jgi:hypothetical protein
MWHEESKPTSLHQTQAGSLDAMLFFDHLYIGGGNARRVKRDELGDVLERTTVVDNSAGILGGVRLWEGDHLGL